MDGGRRRVRSLWDCLVSSRGWSWPQASPHFFRRDFNKLEIGQSVGRSIVVAPRGWPSFSFPRFRAGGNERRVNIRLLQMLMVHVGVKNEGIRKGRGPCQLGRNLHPRTKEAAVAQLPRSAASGSTLT